MQRITIKDSLVTNFFIVLRAIVLAVGDFPQILWTKQAFSQMFKTGRLEGMFPHL